MTVAHGTFSLWPFGEWQLPAVICGTPESAPETPSPNATNWFVGLDAEVLFAAPLPAGGQCDSLESIGYPPHPGRFLIDLGAGFTHFEPLGGARTRPSPGHLYKYLLQGQDEVVRFAWLDSLTSDNYGVLTITIEEVTDSITEVAPAVPESRLVLFRNIPNPFNPTTQIRYETPAWGHVTVRIHDVRGRLMRNLFAGVQDGGPHSLVWNGRSDGGLALQSGIYLVVVRVNGQMTTEKLTLLR